MDQMPLFAPPGFLETPAVPATPETQDPGATRATPTPRLTSLAHEAIESFCERGDFVVDATAGLGRDTVCLARAVGRQGRVAAFEIQPPALEQTRCLLETEGLIDRVELFAVPHEDFRSCLSPDWPGKIRAVVMNLGYLPGGNPHLHTRATSTIHFLDRILPWMASRALFSLLSYRGQEGGIEEFEAVARWCEARHPEGWQLESHRGPSAVSPVLFLLRRNKHTTESPV